MVEVYSASTGRSLYRESLEIDEEEQQYVEQYFRDGIRLSVEPVAGKVAGLVTVIRKTEEPLIFVSEMNDSEPLIGFLNAVRRTCADQDSWNLVSDREEVSALGAADIDENQFNRETVSELRPSLKNPKKTESSHSDYQATVTALARVLRETPFGLIAPGRILVTKKEKPTLDNINHVCVVRGDANTNKDPEDNETRLSSWLRNRFTQLEVRLALISDVS